MTSTKDSSEPSYVAYCDEEDCDWSMSISESDVRSPRQYIKSAAGVHTTRKRDCYARIEINGKEDRDRGSGTGMKLCGVKHNENELQKWLESEFEDRGWMAIREVSPRNSSCSADLIVQHDDYGWFGIEVKYFKGDGGAKAAVAHHQIAEKYRGKKYLGEQINLWCICPYFATSEPGGMYFRKGQFIREFFCRHGIGYLGLNRHDMLMDFAYNDRDMKVPVGARTERFENPDLEKIKKSVSRKMEKYDYTEI